MGAPPKSRAMYDPLLWSLTIAHGECALRDVAVLGGVREMRRRWAVRRLAAAHASVNRSLSPRSAEEREMHRSLGMEANHAVQPYAVSISEPESLWAPASASLAKRAARALEVPRINVHRNERIASSLVGGFLLARAFTRHSPASTLLGLLGSALVYRGVTGHCQLYQVAGLSTAH